MILRSFAASALRSRGKKSARRNRRRLPWRLKKLRRQFGPGSTGACSPAAAREVAPGYQWFSLLACSYGNSHPKFLALASEADESAIGPDSLMLIYPDGNRCKAEFVVADGRCRQINNDCPSPEIPQGQTNNFSAFATIPLDAEIHRLTLACIFPD